MREPMYAVADGTSKSDLLLAGTLVLLRWSWARWRYRHGREAAQLQEVMLTIPSRTQRHHRPCLHHLHNHPPQQHTTNLSSKSEFNPTPHFSNERIFNLFAVPGDSINAKRNDTLTIKLQLKSHHMHYWSPRAVHYHRSQHRALYLWVEDDVWWHVPYISGGEGEEKLDLQL